MASLHNPEIEKFVLAGLLLYPDTWGDVNMVLKDTDFAKTNRPIFSIISQQLEKSPPESVAPIVIAERLKTYGLSALDGNVTVLDYLEAIKILPIDKKEVVNLVKQLKLITVKRDLANKCDEIKGELLHGKDKSFEEMTSLVESGLTSINTEYYSKDETTNICDGLIEEIEERGNNPLNADEMGYMGPFPTWNQSLGSLHNPSDFTLVSARQNCGKSSLGFYVNMCVAEKYNLPVLQIDHSEMTVKQTKARMCAALARDGNSSVPLWAIYSGEWRKNKEWTRLVRDVAWPRVKKLEKNIFFISIGNMKPKEIVNFIRRFYFNKIGRDRHLLIHDDYIKGMESLGQHTQEYQSVGYYVNDIKSLITNDIQASLWSSTQSNRSAITKGKKASELNSVDNEGGISLSDRIIHMATTAFMMRKKEPSEIAEEKNLFGNIKMSLVKQREFLGKDYDKFMSLIKTQGGLRENCYYLQSHNFAFEDKGDLRNAMEVLGNTVDAVNVNKDKISKSDLL